MVTDDIDIEGAAKEPPVGQGQNRVPQPSAAAVGDDSDNRNCKDDEDYCPDADGKVRLSRRVFFRRVWATC